MGKVLVVTSGKGGVGKTTCTANIGAGLALLNRSVVIIDCDIGLRNLDLVMGLENRIVFDLVDVLENKCASVNQALIKDNRFKELYLLPAAQSRDKDAISPESMTALCQNLRDIFDYVVIDCPAGIEMGFKASIAGADEAVIVTNPEVSAIRDADRVAGLWEAEKITSPKLVVNRFKERLAKNGDMLSVEDIQDILGLEVLGVVPDDDAILISSNKGMPCVTDTKTKAGTAYRKIVRRINNPEANSKDTEQKKGLLSGIFRLFGKKG